MSEESLSCSGALPLPCCRPVSPPNILQSPNKVNECLRLILASLVYCFIDSCCILTVMHSHLNHNHCVCLHLLNWRAMLTTNILAASRDDQVRWRSWWVRPMSYYLQSNLRVSSNDLRNLLTCSVVVFIFFIFYEFLRQQLAIACSYPISGYYLVYPNYHYTSRKIAWRDRRMVLACRTYR